jgi:hypothetical protein
MPEDHHELPTPRTTLAASYVRVLVFRRSCRHQRDADLAALVDQGQGDVCRWCSCASDAASAAPATTTRSRGEAGRRV